MKTTILFKCLTEPLRLRILNLLANTVPELCVCDLVTILKVQQAVVSRHLTLLRNANLVRARRSGVWMFYELSPAKGEAHEAIVGYLKSGMKEEPQLERDLRHYAKLKSGGKLECCKDGTSEGMCCPANGSARKGSCR